MKQEQIRVKTQLDEGHEGAVKFLVGCFSLVMAVIVGMVLLGLLMHALGLK